MYTAYAWKFAEDTPLMRKQVHRLCVEISQDSQRNVEAGGTGNDASCGAAGKGWAGSLRPLGGIQFSMSKSAVLTLVPWLAKVPAGRSSYHPPEFSARGFKVACCRGPFAQTATKRPPGFSIFIAC